jgi:hypothetical protein
MFIQYFDVANPLHELHVLLWLLTTSWSLHTLMCALYFMDKPYLCVPYTLHVDWFTYLLRFILVLGYFLSLSLRWVGAKDL